MKNRYEIVPTKVTMKNWSCWFVKDNERGGVNVTSNLSMKLFGRTFPGVVLIKKNEAAKLAFVANLKLSGEV